MTGMAAPEISAKLVMQLRASTGLPMMKCKEALEACGGDFEKAVEWLRKKGLETAAKKADRAMKEGRVAIKTGPDGKSAAMVEVDCETEPVSGGPDFKALVEGCLAAAFEKGIGKAGPDHLIPLEFLHDQKFGKSADTVDVTVKQLVAKIGENMALRRGAALKTAGRIGTYLHFNGKVGVLSAINGPAAAVASADTKAFLDELGMHIAFAKPVAVSRDGVSKELVDKEMEIYREQAKQDPKMAGKPAPVVEKILLGKLDKYFSDKCLLEQPWVKDDKQSVKSMLEATSKKAGGPLVLEGFVLFQVGA